MKIEDIARVCHEANRAYCLSLGDESQLPWDDAPEWATTSAVHGVESAMNGTTPALSHEGWMREKLKDGWLYGPVKDPEKKEHPCMVPYSDLPQDQKVKDHLFVAIARTLGGVA